MASAPPELKTLAGPRVWTWKPELSWFGIRALVPFTSGHDEYSRRTVVIGWPWTGRIILAYKWCGDPACYAESLQMSDPQLRNFDGESSPIATNPILRGVDLAIDRLVAGGVFQGDAVQILDDLRSEVAAVSDPQRRNGE